MSAALCRQALPALGMKPAAAGGSDSDPIHRQIYRCKQVVTAKDTVIPDSDGPYSALFAMHDVNVTIHDSSFTNLNLTEVPAPIALDLLHWTYCTGQRYYNTEHRILEQHRPSQWRRSLLCDE
ncbi:hypothetical protein WJX77_008968 [Trebouxia sp. C0004]